MKTCPTCHTQYTDDTLLYCLQDGSPLNVGTGGDTPTVVLDETETVARGRGWTDSQVTHVRTTKPPRKGSNTAIAVILTVIGMLFLFGIAGVAAWIFLKNDPAGNANNASVPGVTNVSPTPSRTLPASPTATASTTPTATPTPSNSPATNVSNDSSEVQQRRDVGQRIERWRSALESRDLNGLMDNYAPTVNYFRRRNASSAFVRSDKARAFALYSSMRVDVSNMVVSVGPSGDTATATFDKEWVFTGRDTNAGKVRSQVELRRSGDRWLITGERDLRVYYTR